jgi:hypothetical protein
MANDTRRFIELPDILALRFERKECGSALSVSPDEYLKPVEGQRLIGDRLRPVLVECTFCGSQWGSYEPAVTMFVEQLKKLIDVVRRTKAGNDYWFFAESGIKDEKQSDGKTGPENEHATRSKR